MFDPAWLALGATTSAAVAGIAGLKPSARQSVRVLDDARALILDDLEARRRARLDPKRSGPLAGLRVVDLGTTNLGPDCTALLASWGAEVIAVEAATSDAVRVRTNRPRPTSGPFLRGAKRDKRMVVLNPETAGGSNALERLIESSDMVVHALPADSARGLSLDAESIVARHPRCVALALRELPAAGTLEQRTAGFYAAAALLAAVRQRDLTGHGVAIDVSASDVNSSRVLGADDGALAPRSLIE